MFRQDGSCPALLADPCSGFPYGAVTRSGSPFQALRVPKAQATGLFRVRSPLLTESRLMSVPPATEMFQFAGFASPSYEFRRRYPCGWVAPFGDPGITDRSHLPRAFRSVPRPSSPLSAKASTRCPCFALDHRRLPSEDAAQPPRTGPRPPKGFHPARRPRMKTLLRIGATQVWLRRSASVTSQLSLFTLQSTPASQGLRGCSRLRQNAAAHPHGGGAHGGGERDRTDDLLLAKQALSQLSYTPMPEDQNAELPFLAFCRLFI